MTKSSITHSMLVLGLGLMLASCSSMKVSFETSEITGDNSVRNQQVNDQYAKMSGQSTVLSKILSSDNSLPEGFKKSGDLISVEKGYNHKILGKVYLKERYGDIPWAGFSEQDALIEAKRMAAAAGGDFVFAAFKAYVNSSIRDCSYWIIKLDPKVKKKLLGR